MKPRSAVIAPAADAAYVKAFAQIMGRIERAVSKGKSTVPIVACIAGGAALHFYTGARISKDIDAKVMTRFIPPDDLAVSYKDADGRARLLYFDTQYNDSFSLLHEDAYEDALPIRIPGIDPRRLDIRLLSPLDLAVSKLSRFEVHDQEDIRSLARAGLIDSAQLRARAEEALPNYVGDVNRVKNSITLAAKLIDKVRSTSPGASR